MGNSSQINRSRDSVRVERRSDLNESDLGEVYCISAVLGGLDEVDVCISVSCFAANDKLFGLITLETFNQSWFCNTA